MQHEGTDGDGGARRVVVIDDDASIREVAVLALSVVGGYAVDAAADGAHGLDIVGRTRPDAVLLDVMMPVVDGPTILAAMRADERLREIPVVLLTAKLRAEDTSAWRAQGATGVIAKPFDPMTLAHEVAELLGWTS